MPEPIAETAPEPSPEQCFTIFEGGGAKGITHLGALKALEDVRLARIGAAGTSAGAIIAVLTAVGYSADELFDPDDGDNILARLDKTPIDLLRRDDWGVFTRLRGSKTDGPLADWGRTLRKGVLVVALAVLPPLLPVWVFSLARSSGRPAVFGCAWRVLEHFGFFSTEDARDILNALLCSKLGLANGHLVTFADIDPETRRSCSALKIISTNLVRGTLELFDQTSPTVVVADAVAASFAIPVFFKPARVRHAVNGREIAAARDDLYVDGGLVSNLPVWVFFEDKKGVERLPENREKWPIPIVAFRLADATIDQKSAKSTSLLGRCVSYVGDVIRTGIFGGQSISQNFVTHLTVVDLPTPLTVIQFGCTKAEAQAAYRSGYRAASEHLRRVFQINPFARREVLEDLMRAAKARSKDIRIAAGVPPIEQFRACLLRPLGNRSLKVIASLGMDQDTDDDLVLDQRNPGAPTAFYERDFTFVDVRTGKDDLRMTKYERALVRRQLESIIAVPIFGSAGEWAKLRAERAEPAGAFCLDSDFVLDLEFGDREFLRILAEGTVRFAPLMVFEKEVS